jgi:hypothetical protein
MKSEMRTLRSVAQLLDVPYTDLRYAVTITRRSITPQLKSHKVSKIS